MFITLSLGALYPMQNVVQLDKGGQEWVSKPLIEVRAVNPSHIRLNIVVLQPSTAKWATKFAQNIPLR